MEREGEDGMVTTTTKTDVMGPRPWARRLLVDCSGCYSVVLYYG
jgi:hypothetical protein